MEEKGLILLPDPFSAINPSNCRFACYNSQAVINHRHSEPVPVGLFWRSFAHIPACPRPETVVLGRDLLTCDGELDHAAFAARRSRMKVAVEQGKETGDFDAFYSLLYSRVVLIQRHATKAWGPFGSEMQGMWVWRESFAEHKTDPVRLAIGRFDFEAIDVLGECGLLESKHLEEVRRPIFDGWVRHNPTPFMGSDTTKLTKTLLAVLCDHGCDPNIRIGSRSVLFSSVRSALRSAFVDNGANLFLLQRKRKSNEELQDTQQWCEMWETWSPQTHAEKAPRFFRQRVFAFLCCIRRLRSTGRSRISPDAIVHIIRCWALADRFRMQWEAHYLPQPAATVRAALTRHKVPGRSKLKKAAAAKAAASIQADHTLLTYSMPPIFRLGREQPQKSKDELRVENVARALDCGDTVRAIALVSRDQRGYGSLLSAVLQKCDWPVFRLLISTLRFRVKLQPLCYTSYLSAEPKMLDALFRLPGFSLSSGSRHCFLKIRRGVQHEPHFYIFLKYGMNPMPAGSVDGFNPRSCGEVDLATWSGRLQTNAHILTPWLSAFTEWTPKVHAQNMPYQVHQEIFTFFLVARRLLPTHRPVSKDVVHLVARYVATRHLIELVNEAILSLFRACDLRECLNDLNLSRSGRKLILVKRLAANLAARELMEWDGSKSAVEYIEERRQSAYNLLAVFYGPLDASIVSFVGPCERALLALAAKEREVNGEEPPLKKRK